MVSSKEGACPLTDAQRLEVFRRYHKPLVDWAKRFRGASMDMEDREAEALCVLWEFSAQYDPNRSDTFFALCTKPLGERLLNAPRNNEMGESARQRRYVRRAMALLSEEELALPLGELVPILMKKLKCDKDSAFSVYNIIVCGNAMMGELDDAKGVGQRNTETDRYVENDFAALCFTEAQRQLCRYKGRTDCPYCNEAVRYQCPFFCLLYAIGADGWWCDGDRKTGEGMEATRKDEDEAAKQLGLDPAAYRAMVAKARRVMGEVQRALAGEQI